MCVCTRYVLNLIVCISSRAGVTFVSTYFFLRGFPLFTLLVSLYRSLMSESAVDNDITMLCTVSNAICFNNAIGVSV